MKRLLCFCLATGGLVSTPGWAANAIYDNHAILTTPPAIDAISFVNHGTFNIAVFPGPFESFSTLNYTNFGILACQNGWRFETTPPISGARHMAANFVNHNPGVVQAVDPFAVAPHLPCFPALYDPSYLLVSATNIITGAGAPALGASLIAGANGWLQLLGSQVDASDSGLEILPVWDEFAGSFWLNTAQTLFQPDIAISDIYWGQGSFAPPRPLLNSAGIWNGAFASAPSMPSPPTAPGPSTPFTLFTPTADSYVVSLNAYTLFLTNIIGPPTNVIGSNVIAINLASNLFKGAVFASAPPEFRIDIGFLPSPAPDNFFNTASLVFTTQMTNVVNATTEPATLFVEDTLASDTFRGLSTNIIGCSGATFRPKNYLVDRTSLVLGGAGNNGYPDPFFYTKTGVYLTDTNIWIDTVTNAIVRSGDYADYLAFADNIVTRPSAVSGGNDTNYPGRVRLFADNLNLENTRIRGEGEIFIQSKHLVSTRGTVIDCENLNLSLATTNDSLTVQSLTPTNVHRLRGPLYLWSAVWTNQAIIVFTNNYILSNAPVFSPPGSTNVVGTNLVGILNPITNFVTLGLTATLVDGDALQTVLPVNVFELAAKGKDIAINDSMTIYRRLQVDGNSLTLNGNLTIPGFYPPDPITGLVPPDPVVDGWNAGIAPNLRYLTNNGTLTLYNEAHFGDDRVFSYTALVNNGTINADSILANSAYYENRGTLIAVDALRLYGAIGKMEGGSSTSGNVTEFTGANVKFNRYQLTANGPLIFTVTNSLDDAGSASANTFRLLDGFRLNLKPQVGDLFGTTIQDVAPQTPSVIVNHFWAGEDRGPSAGGFTNNATVGHLVLSSQSPNPSFRFYGVGAQNGLYVDVLDLSALTDIDNQIQIAPNLTIYFAAAKLGFTPPPNGNGIAQEPEEYLNGRFGGRLRWVPSFAGPNSSRPVVINGQTYYVNKALADSKIIDSDGDGVPNYFDAGCCGDTFVIAPITVNVLGNGQVAPQVSGQKLIVGLTYTLFAQPGEGASFTGWSGDVTTASQQVTFVMNTNLTLTATFTFTPTAATYRGLFYEAGGVEFQKSGSFTATTTSKGAYSAAIQMGSKKYSFTGRLDASGADTRMINRSGTTPLTVHLQAGRDHLTGTIGDGTWLADLAADRRGFNAVTNRTPLAGRYTIRFPGSGDASDASKPLGDGYGTVKLDGAGTVTFAGTLADGTKASQSSALSANAQWPLYVPLYSGKGQILGWITFAGQADEDLDGTVSWIKQPSAASKYYSGGIDLDMAAAGSLYNPLLAPVTGFSEGTLTFSGGNLASGFEDLAAVSPASTVTDLSGHHMKLTVTKSNGLFSGSVVDPLSGRTVKFNGALLQRSQIGAGFFLGTNQVGNVLWKPTP